MAAGDYAFGARSLNDSANVFCIGAAPPAVPVDLLGLPLGRYEGMAVVDVRYPAVDIPVNLLCRNTTATLTEASLDALLKDLYNGEQNLKLGYQDERYWPARLRSVAVQKLALVQYELAAVFLAPDAFGYANAASNSNSASALSLVSGTHYSKTLTPTVGGTIYSRPIFTITVPAGGGSPFGLFDIWVVNASLTPSPQLTVTRTFAASDVLVIDCARMTVKLNGVEVEYSGQFPTLDPRVGTTNNIELHARASSTPTLTIAIDWTPRFAA